MELIEVKKLSKSIHGKEILKDISFEISQGDCVALIGPNGAGKTTLMDCLLGDKFLTAGEARIQGLKPTDNHLKQSVAILPQENTVVEDLKVKELLTFFQAIYPNSLSDQEIDDLLQFTDKQKNQLASKLSGGQKRIFSFVLSLIGRPKILFLDEPTLGLDVRARRELWKKIEQLKGKVTVILTTHYLEEAEALADRLCIMDKGMVQILGTAEEIIQDSGKKDFEEAFLSYTEGGELA